MCVCLIPGKFEIIILDRKARWLKPVRTVVETEPPKKITNHFELSSKSHTNTCFLFPHPSNFVKVTNGLLMYPHASSGKF